MENTNPSPSQIVLYSNTFFKFCTIWNKYRCSEKLTRYERKYLGISFGNFISRNIL